MPNRTYGKPLKDLDSIKPPSLWKRLWLRVVNVKCLTCGTKLNEAYWLKQYPHPVPFDNLVRMICEDRRRCLDCALAEERMEAVDNDRLYRPGAP